MNDRTNGKRHIIFPLLAFITVIGCQTGPSPSAAQDPQPAAQPAPSDRFDLVVYGFDFDPAEHELFLRTNLDFGSEWISLGTLDGATRAGGTDDSWAAAVFSGLDTERFLGQDFRESYLEVRIMTRDGSDGSRVSALYAMPHLPEARNAATPIQRLIETDPLLVEQHSLASHVQPSPRSLQPGVVYVEHVRAPMKHTLPGVMEVRQLQVEWRNRGH